jgi:hypothetical protein
MHYEYGENSTEKPGVAYNKFNMSICCNLIVMLM